MRVASILTAFLLASLHPGGATWLFMTGAGHPKLGNPSFEQLLPRKHRVFRKSSFFLSTLRGEFEAGIHSDRIFTGKSAHGRRARDPEASVAPLIQDRKNPTGSSCFGSPLWGMYTKIIKHMLEKLTNMVPKWSQNLSKIDPGGALEAS